MTARRRTFSIILFSLLLAASRPFAETSPSVKVVPYPIVEAVDIISHWLADNGFEVSQGNSGDASINLGAIKGGEEWQVMVIPRSPLASEIRPHYAHDHEPDETKIGELWTYLDAYSEGQGGDVGQAIPPAVLSQRECRVCIKARASHGNIQFSGFIMDEGGLILSTAHDLEHVKEVTVIMNGGETLAGDLIGIDPLRDLSLIKVHKRLTHAVFLDRARNLLAMGERIYSIGCPNNQSDTILSGTILGPPRLADDLPLWQAKMKVFEGNSGSPAFDEQGNLVGVVKGRYRGTDSIGFLIPFETIAEFLKGMQTP